MAKCTSTPDLFPACKSRKIDIDFEGGDITSDAVGLLLRQVDRKLGLAPLIGENKHEVKVLTHGLLSANVQNDLHFKTPF